MKIEFNENRRAMDEVFKSAGPELAFIANEPDKDIVEESTPILLRSFGWLLPAMPFRGSPQSSGHNAGAVENCAAIGVSGLLCSAQNREVLPDFLKKSDEFRLYRSMFPFTRLSFIWHVPLSSIDSHQLSGLALRAQAHLLTYVNSSFSQS